MIHDPPVKPARLVLATGNAHKVLELRALLPGIPLAALSDFPSMDEPAETAPDYAGNALIKARAVFEHTGELSLADDSGLEVEGLDWAPGIRSARYVPGTDADRRHAVIEALKLRGPAASRRARFVCAIAVVGPAPGHEAAFERVYQAACEGVIIDDDRGEGGFGYDPVFLVPELRRTFAEIPAIEKHALSHRGRAAALALADLRRFFGEPPAGA